MSEQKRCHDCGVKEGQLHEGGCDMERCPFCGGQLIGCDCCYEKLGLFDREKYDASTSFLPPEIYSGGLTEEQSDRWDAILREKGLIPYIVYPNLCAKCGKLWPEMFRVSDDEWRRYIQPDMRREMICLECWTFITTAVDAAAPDVEPGEVGT